MVIITPGVDMALVTQNALLHGRGPALATAIGVNVGIMFWTIAAAVGVAALVAGSQTAFTVIKLSGAVYLVGLGAAALWASRTRKATGAELPPHGRLAGGTALRQGVVSNLLNPKIAVFFTSLLPQFVGHRAGAVDLLALGAIFNAMCVLWLACYAIVAARGRAALARPRIKRALDRLSGVVLIGLGARLAFERR